MKRKAKILRKTKETSISVEANIDGTGKYKIKTGIGFLDHMLEQLSKHALRVSTNNSGKVGSVFLYKLYAVSSPVIETSDTLIICPSSKLSSI